jgi:hypothetical protein
LSSAPASTEADDKEMDKLLDDKFKIIWKCIGQFSSGMGGAEGLKKAPEIDRQVKSIQYLVSKANLKNKSQDEKRNVLELAQEMLLPTGKMVEAYTSNRRKKNTGTPLNEGKK